MAKTERLLVPLSEDEKKELIKQVEELRKKAGVDLSMAAYVRLLIRYHNKNRVDLSTWMQQRLF